MDTIRVRALANVMGMSRGNEYILNVNSTVDALLDRGYILWLDQPEASEPSYDLSTEILQRAAVFNKPAVKKAARQGPKPVAEVTAPAIKPSPKRSDVLEDAEADELAEAALQELAQLNEFEDLYDDEFLDGQVSIANENFENEGGFADVESD